MLPIIHLSGPLDDRKRDHMLSGYPGTPAPGGPSSGPLKSRVARWRVRVRPPEFGGYPLVAGTRRLAPLLVSCTVCTAALRTWWVGWWFVGEPVQLAKFWSRRTRYHVSCVQQYYRRTIGWCCRGVPGWVGCVSAWEGFKTS